MTKHEFATWFAEQVPPRWPTWQVNGVLLGDWYAALGGYDAGTLTQAVQQHAIGDSPSQPRVNQVRALARQIADAATRRAPTTEPPAGMVTASQFWEHVRKSDPWEQRIALMKNLAKLGPQFRERDPQAYDWIMEHRAAQTADEPATATADG